MSLKNTTKILPALGLVVCSIAFASNAFASSTCGSTSGTYVSVEPTTNLCAVGSTIVGSVETNPNGSFGWDCQDGIETVISCSTLPTTLIGVPSSLSTGLLSGANSLIGDFWPLLLVVVGIPFGLYIIKKVIALIPKK